MRGGVRAWPTAQDRGLQDEFLVDLQGIGDLTKARAHQAKRVPGESLVEASQETGKRLLLVATLMGVVNEAWRGRREVPQAVL